MTTVIKIFDNTDLFVSLNRYLQKNIFSKVFVLVDENTKKHCLPILGKKILIDFISIEIKSGEKHKNLDTTQQIWEKLTVLGADRQSVLLNLGGGVITDMGGFAAETFKRGIHFINIPTTLLAMVDAAIGGKTAVDFKGLKNQIGLFANAEMILIYPDFLKTLPQRELRSGLAEVIKYGLIDDIDIWKEIKNLHNDNITTKIIKKSIAIKERIVSEDPKENGIRKILNFGHTLGHAIETHFLEKTIDKQLLHGEAIAIGMILAAHLSFQTQGFPLVIVDEISLHIKRLFKRSIPAAISQKDYQPILNLLQHDKKNNMGEINFILLKAIGIPVLDCQVSEREITTAFEYFSVAKL